jgi:hypothetical protein
MREGSPICTGTNERACGAVFIDVEVNGIADWCNESVWKNWQATPKRGSRTNDRERKPWGFAVVLGILWCTPDITSCFSFVFPVPDPSAAARR